MKRLPCALFFAAISCSSLTAEESSPGAARRNESPTEQRDLPNPILAPQLPRAIATSPRARAISPKIAELLAARAAKYADLPPPPPGEPSRSLEPSAADTGVVLLPRYVVQEQRLRELKERDILTPKGAIAKSMKAHPGLVLSEGGPFFSWATVFANEQASADRAKEMAELSGLLPKGGGRNRDLDRKIQQSQIRQNELQSPVSKPDLERGLAPFEKR